MHVLCGTFPHPRMRCRSIAPEARIFRILLLISGRICGLHPPKRRCMALATKLSMVVTAVFMCRNEIHAVKSESCSTGVRLGSL